MTPGRSLAGRRALVTGGAQRIGRAIALALAAAGADVAITFRESQGEAEATAAEIAALGSRALPVWCDVAEEAGVAAAVERVASEFGGLDVLVNNAGVFASAKLEEITVAAWDAMFATNTRGPWLLARAALPHLRAAGGRIINIGSLGGSHAWATHGHYCASKAALHTLTQVMAKAWAPEVSVNAVAPGMIVTGAESEATYRRFAEKTPMRRNGTPEEVAEAVLFFAAATPVCYGAGACGGWRPGALALNCVAVRGSTRLTGLVSSRRKASSPRLSVEMPRIWIRPYYSGFNGLRAVAILMVFLRHYGRLLIPTPIWSVLWSGVDLFFVLSGFLITGILFDSADAPRYFRNFYIRRALRIFPLFYALFAVLFLLTPILHLQWPWALLSFPLYFGNLILPWVDLAKHNPTTMFMTIGARKVPIISLGTQWSLCVRGAVLPTLANDRMARARPQTIDAYLLGYGALYPCTEADIIQAAYPWFLPCPPVRKHVHALGSTVSRRLDCTVASRKPAHEASASPLCVLVYGFRYDPDCWHFAV